jgi:hypothetical protein
VLHEAMAEDAADGGRGSGVMAGSAPLCKLEGCTRRVYVDVKAARVYDYCGRRHAAAALAAEGRGPLGRPSESCAFPGCDRPVWFDEDVGRVHDYCGIKHVQEAEALGLWRSSNRRLQGQAATPEMRCALPGCSAPRFVDLVTGHVYDFCGRTHAVQAHSKGMLGTASAGVEGNMVDRVWRGRDGEADYVISMLTNSHPKYRGIKSQFQDTWRAPAGSKPPTVMRIYQVRNPEPVFHAFCQYKESLVAAAIRRIGGEGEEGGGGAGDGEGGGDEGRTEKGGKFRRREAIGEGRRWHGAAMSPSCSFGGLRVEGLGCSV